MSEKTLTDATYRSTLQSSEGTAFLYVWAPWCGPCRMIKPNYTALSDEYKHEAAFWKANLEEFEVVAEELGIKSTPTLIAYQAGVEVGRRSGAMMKAQLEKWVTGHLVAL